MILRIYLPLLYKLGMEKVQFRMLTPDGRAGKYGGTGIEIS